MTDHAQFFFTRNHRLRYLSRTIAPNFGNQWQIRKTTSETSRWEDAFFDTEIHFGAKMHFSHFANTYIPCAPPTAQQGSPAGKQTIPNLGQRSLMRFIWQHLALAKSLSHTEKKAGYRLESRLRQARYAPRLSQGAQLQEPTYYNTNFPSFLLTEHDLLLSPRRRKHIS